MNDGRIRFYLWVPYERYGELDHLMKSRGSCVQELLRRAIERRNRKDGKKGNAGEQVKGF